MGNNRYRNGFEVTLQGDVLELPLHWKRPRKIFVNSMSDLFHEDVPDEYIRRTFDVMGRAHWHVFQILTKRAERLAKLAPSLSWPKNIWQGVSVENADHVWRVDHLLQVPSGVRFISVEPLLGPIEALPLKDIAWVIVGGERGFHHRKVDAAWVRLIRDQCLRAKVPFFFKQWGGHTPKARGRQLDGRHWNQYPRAPTTQPSLTNSFIPL